MDQNQPTDNDPKLTLSEANADVPKVWRPVEEGISLHIPSGIFYERPTINRQPTWRSLKTRKLKQASRAEANCCSAFRFRAQCRQTLGVWGPRSICE
jgi:hypothetical protein